MNCVEFTNPFVRKWADEYAEDELYALFSEFIIPLIPKFFDYPNVFLYGGSGTGKTMLFRYLSFAVQKNYLENQTETIEDIAEFFRFSSSNIQKVLGREVRHFGIYHKLTDTPSILFETKCESEQEKQALFQTYLDLEISIRFLDSIDGLLAYCTDERKTEEIKSKLLECVKKCSDISPSARFEDILDYVAGKKREIDLYLGSLELSKDGVSSTAGRQLKIGGFFRLFLNLAQTLKSQVEDFRDVAIYVLLDEYEKILEHQKLLINALVRERNKFLEFKISSRRYGLTTLRTLNPKDFMVIGRDAELIDLEYIFRREKGKYRRLLHDVARRRLESEPFFRESKLTDVRKILDSLTPEAEAHKVCTKRIAEPEHRNRFMQFLARHNVRNPRAVMTHIKCDDRPLVEKLNMLLVKRRIVYGEKSAKHTNIYDDEEIRRMADTFIRSPSESTTYHHLYEKNKMALLFQLVNEYGKYGERKTYAGFETFVALSGGFTAWFLELCYTALEFAKDKGDFADTLKISPESQRRAAETVAWDFLQNAVKNVEQVGSDIYYFVLNTGAFFRALHLDELVREPEPTYFNTKTAELTDLSRKVVETAHHWSVLQSKTPMKPKAAGEPLPDVHILHPILAPAFQISYRTRGRTQLPSNDVELLIQGSDRDIKKLVTKYRDKSLAQKREGQDAQKDFFAQ